MKAATYIIAFLLLFTIVSCLNLTGYKYNKGTLPLEPINLSDFNTEFDDYNSTAPSLGYLIPFCFSTNRRSNGDKFDVIYQPMNVNFDKSSGELKVTNEYANWSSIKDDYKFIESGLVKINTPSNEFGPNLMVDRSSNDIKFTLLYSTNESGDAQIKYISALSNERFSDPQEVKFLNSEYEDLYPTFNQDNSRIYFCSNREDDNFDFYYVDVDNKQELEAVLSKETSVDIIKDTTLSSSYEDKCPFIFQDKLVFTSNRPGGFGGYDLYYSDFVDGMWSDPVNFGSEINSASDEFRPILLDEGVSWTQTMMVFSSDRVGGLGGFDLYFVGIDHESK